MAQTRGHKGATRRRCLTALVATAVVAAVAAPAAPAVAASAGAQAAATGAAPGAPGVDEQYLPADKSGFGTATTRASKVWFTVQKEGGLGEIYYPTVGRPAARALQFVVADGTGTPFAPRRRRDVRTTLTDQQQPELPPDVHRAGRGAGGSPRPT